MKNKALTIDECKQITADESLQTLDSNNNNLNVLEVEINILKAQTAQNIIEIGKRLIEAKKQVGHGNWGKWLEKKVEFSQVYAANLMKIAKEYSNLNTCLNLSYNKMLELLEVPMNDRDEFIKNHPIYQMTVKELKEKIKEENEAKKSVEDKKKEIEKEIKKLEGKIKKLENGTEIPRELQDQLDSLNETISNIKKENEGAKKDKENAEKSKKKAEEDKNKISSELKNVKEELDYFKKTYQEWEIIKKAKQKEFQEYMSRKDTVYDKEGKDANDSLELFKKLNEIVSSGMKIVYPASSYKSIDTFLEAALIVMKGSDIDLNVSLIDKSIDILSNMKNGLLDTKENKGKLRLVK